jgi:hypothetical protein
VDGTKLNWLFWTAPQWQLAANVATVAGILLAMGAGVIAFISYRASNRASENSHMHALFNDYLRIRFDHCLHVNGQEASHAAKTSASSSLEEEVASIKLYVVEEMWAWIDRQRRDPLHFLHWSPSSRRRLRETLEAWEATIFSHVDDDEVEVLTSLHYFTPCFSLGFLGFLADHWRHRPNFVAMVERQRGTTKREPHCRTGSLQQLLNEREPGGP